ncbi:CHAT domain-containing protein [Winogradskyella sp.]|uniref:CHAT domain-containing protein n=1 Tax=Winogradskyella sp. TaxID=1883156 RepID=UPI002638DA16|nr:CHAT domain-containing tetratricopeptide repeat protein [Winogradskyella sp.]
MSVSLLKLTSQVKTSDIKLFDSISSKLYKENKFDSLAKFAHDKSIEFYKRKDFTSAIKYAEIEVAIGLRSLDSVAYKNALFNLGLFYLRNKNYYQSVATHQKVIDSFDIDKKTFQSYCELGRLYRRLGDFHQAVSYFEKGISEPTYFAEKELIINYSNLLDVYDTYNTNIDGFLEKKLNLLKKVDALIRSIKLDDFRVTNNEINFGNYYSNEEVLDIQKAKFHFDRALERAKSVNDTSKMALINNNLGYLYNLANNDSSLLYIKRGIKLSHPNDPILIKLYTNLSEYYYRKDNIDLAIKANHKELSLLLPEYLDLNAKSMPSLETITLSQDKTHTVFTLKNRALFLVEKYKSSNQIKDIKLAKETVILADHLIDNIKKESIAIKNKLFWQQEASQIYMLAIRVSYILNDIETAFYFMEKKKAVLLLDNLTEKELRKQLKIPDSVLEKEFIIKQSISDIENKIYYSDKTKLDSLSKILNSLKIKHTEFLKKLKNKYSDYYDSKVTNQIINLKNVQENLEHDNVILEYVLDSSGGYLMTISRNSIGFFNFGDTEELTKKISEFNSTISQPFTTTEQKSNFNKIAYSLYNELIPVSLENAKKLIIIPDYNLQVLSFEALKTSDNDKDYLIKRHEISYAYSLTFSNKNSKAKENYKSDITAFAPVTFNNGLAELNNTRNEISKLKQLLNGDFYLNDQANKDNFLNNISNSQIIHLATHANANDSISPWIALQNEKIYLNELYNIQSNAQLVTLSACNTASGQIKEGEGIFSLARGFFHSGSKSVASTLWNVNDKSTSLIIEEFYKNLNQGQTKSEALRNSKLSYLEKNSLSNASPYYWASFVLIGDTNTVSLDNSYFFYYYLTIIILLIIITLYFTNKKKRGI